MSLIEISRVPTARETTDSLFASSVQNLYNANEMEVPFIDLVTSVPVTHMEDLPADPVMQLILEGMKQLSKGLQTLSKV